MTATLERESAAYERHKERARETQRRNTRAGQDIGDIPPIKDRKRREACIESFLEFCKVYLPDHFALPWSPNHIRAAEKIEQAVRTGGLFAFAMPRGSGKTTLSRAAVLWAILGGHVKCAVLLAAAERSAERHLKFGLKKTLLKNDMLLEDFPHAIYPIRCLDGEARMASGQRYRDEKTFIEWAANHVTFAWIPEDESLSSGAVLETMGMTAEIRGPLYTQPDGTQIRPQFVMADDVQTRESAKSITQTQSRLETLTGDVQYLGGPDSPLSIVHTCTVIYENDLADQLLDRDKHPEWQGERTKMVEQFPNDLTLWDQYADILRDSLRDTGDRTPATDFYLKHREEMDRGFMLSWPERHYDYEVSGIQHAMNKKLAGEAAFWAEYQNEPITPQDDLAILTADEICERRNGYARRQVPDDVSLITAFTDVQKEHLFWMVVGWAPDFTGYVLDYGAWPDQKRAYFKRSEVRKRLSVEYPGDESGMMYAALGALERKLWLEPWTVFNGTDVVREMQIGRWCIDANWRVREAAVKAYARQSERASSITLTYGRGVKATQQPFSQSQRAKEWRTEHGHWFWYAGPGPARGVIFDANTWKKRVHDGLSLALGSRGGISLFGRGANSQTHRMLADHLTAERPVKVEAGGRVVYEWVEIPGRDNEGLDCLVGCALAASIAGLAKDTEKAKARRPTKKRSMRERMAANRG